LSRTGENSQGYGISETVISPSIGADWFPSHILVTDGFLKGGRKKKILRLWAANLESFREGLGASFYLGHLSSDGILSLEGGREKGVLLDV